MTRVLTAGRSKRIVATLVVIAALLAVGGLAGTVAADGHTKADAPYYENTNESANATVLVEDGKRYSGASNADVRYTLFGNEAFDDVNMSDGIDADYIVLVAEWLDHSDCSTENTEVFGIDRGNDDPGTHVDEDLVQYQKRVQYTEDGITVEFFDHEDFAGSPPNIYPEDEIVYASSDDSNGGACVDVTGEPGTYTADIFINGSDANTNDTDAPVRGFTVESNEVTIEETDGRPTVTPTPEPTPTPTPGPGPTTPTPAPETPFVSESANQSVGPADVSGQFAIGPNGVSADGSVEASEDDSAGGADAPVAIGMLAAGALLIRRRTR